MRSGRVRGKLLLITPPGLAARKSFDFKLDTSLGDRENNGQGNTFDSFGKDFASSDDLSVALLNAAPPMPEPDLAGMTDEEIRIVKAVTSAEMDGPAGNNMTQILLETDAAERHTLEMVTTALGGEGQKPNQDVRATREHIRMSLAWDLCGPDQIGHCSAYRKRVFRASKMRFDVQFEVPVIFLCSPNSTQCSLGSRDKVPLLFVNGTSRSEVDTRTQSLEAEERQRTLRRHGKVERDEVRAATNPRAGWYILLQQLHKMERNIGEWEESMLTGERRLKREQIQQGATLAWTLPSQVARWEARSHAVALQPQRQTWNTLPANLTRPCAATTLRYMVAMAAILWLNLKAFDRAAGIYFAEGNGYNLSGCHEPDFGVLFEFGTTGVNKFARHHLIPTNDISAMACSHIHI